MKRTQQFQKELHENVLSYAIGQFRRHGVRAVKVDDIANSLGMSKRTLYQMFGDKEGLLVESIKRDTELRQQRHEQIFQKAANPLEAYVSIYRLRMEDMRNLNPNFIQEIYKYERVREYMEQQRHNHADKARQFAHECVRQGLMRDDINYELLSRMNDVIADQVIKGNMLARYTYEEVFRTLDLPHLRGLCTRRGLEILEQLD